MTEVEYQWTADSLRDHLHQTISSIQQLQATDADEAWPALRDRLGVEWGEGWAQDWPLSRLLELVEADGDEQDMTGWPDRANTHTETVVWELEQSRPEADPVAGDEVYAEPAPADEPVEEPVVASVAAATEEVVEQIALPALEELLAQAPEVARLTPEQLGALLGETVHEVLNETAGSDS